MPTPSIALQRPELAEMVRGFDSAANQLGLVGSAVMPIVGVRRKTGAFPKLKADQILKRADTKRAPRGAYNRIEYEFEQDTYNCEEYGLESPVDKALAEAYKTYVEAEMDAADLVQANIMYDHELRVRAIVAAETANAVTTPWTTSASADPKATTKAGITAIRKRTGMRPNLMVFTEAVLDSVIVTDSFLDTAKYTGNPLTLDLQSRTRLVSEYLDVPVRIAGAVENQAQEGLDFDGADIWPDDEAFLCIARPTLRGGPKFGLTLRWDDDSLAGVESYYQEEIRADVIRAYQNLDEKIVLSTAGYRLTNLAA